MSTGVSPWRGMPARVARSRRGPWPRRIALLAVLVLAVPAVLVGTAAAGLRWEAAGKPAAAAHTRHRDALWLGHAWVDGRKQDADVARLAKTLSGTGIANLYVHSGPLADTGALAAELHPRARWFADAVHRSLPGVRVQAWLGDFVAPEHNALRLDDAASRDRVVAAATQMLDLGFDGVHFDLEPVRSGSAGYLALLDRTRAVTATRHALLSVSAPQLDPLPALHAFGIALLDHGKYWAQGYFAEVARRVDQIAVMSYDTSMPTAALYAGYVAEQTTLALQVTPQRTDLLMGVPMFWADDSGHRGAAETVDAALRGIRLGLGRTAPGRPGFGAALYVDFTATPADWASYRQSWCPPMA